MMQTVRQSRRRIPMVQLVRARLLEFVREPEAVFWVCGFPILMVVALGVAFRNKPVEKMTVTLTEGPIAQTLADTLTADGRFTVRVEPLLAARQRLRTAKTDLVVTPPDSNTGTAVFLFDPTRAEGMLARNAVNDVLQRWAGRIDPLSATEEPWVEKGGRYVDFLVPGLLGMSLMGGGLWGVGFVTVDMRMRKLLKRYLATPMRKSEFLAGIMCSRLMFLIPEVLLLLVFSRYAFDVVIYGSLWAVTALVFLGAYTFAGVGLLIACRARTMEAVSGLMNLVMLPMWVMSGIFFSSERFPESMQPLIKLLPLTPLLDALREVMQEGASLAGQAPRMLLLFVWGTASFVLALRWFRWS